MENLRLQLWDLDAIFREVMILNHEKELCMLYAKLVEFVREQEIGRSISYSCYSDYWFALAQKICDKVTTTTIIDIEKLRQIGLICEATVKENSHICERAICVTNKLLYDYSSFFSEEWGEKGVVLRRKLRNLAPKYLYKLFDKDTQLISKIVSNDYKDCIYSTDEVKKRYEYADLQTLKELLEELSVTWKNLVDVEVVEKSGLLKVRFKLI